MVLKDRGETHSVRVYLLVVVALVVFLALGSHLLAPLTLALVVGAVLLTTGWFVRRAFLFRAPSSGVHWQDVMPCYLSVQNRDLEILDVNALFRRDIGEGIGRRCFEVYKNRQEPCPNCPILLTFEDGQDHRSEETITTKDGTSQRVVVTSTPLFDQEGKISAVVEMSTNTSEVEELRHELERSRKYFQQLFDIVPCYITVQNKDFELIESNRLFRQDFGEIGNERERCHQRYKNKDSICPDCPVRKTFLDGKIHCSEEQVTTLDGRKVALIVYSMPVFEESGEITSVMEVSTNITQVKELQRQLAMVGLAVSGMAHRMKNVLMGLEGGIFVVNTGFEDQDQETIDAGWEMVERNVAKVSRMAKDLLFCSKERLPKLEEGVSPKAIAREVHHLFVDRASQDSITLGLELEEGEDTGSFDAEAIHNLMANLVANALDACRFDDGENKAHQIDLACRADPTNVSIEVSDNGAGIPDEDSHRIFQSFFSSKGTEGTGLGLFVVQKVVMEHGGTIEFETAEGHGTTFRVVLPRHPKDNEKDAFVTTIDLEAS